MSSCAEASPKASILVGGTWVPAKGNGATLVQTIDSAGSDYTVIYTHTAADGTVTDYRVIGFDAVAPDDSRPRSYTISGGRGECKITTPVGRLPAASLQCAVPVSISAPGREKIDLTWYEAATSCSFSGSPSTYGWTCHVEYGRSGISDQSGYKLDIRSNKVMLINTAIEDCSFLSCTGNWPAATYSEPVSGTQQVVDSKGGTWIFTFDSSLRMTSIKRPTDSTASTAITYYTSNKVASVTKDGVTKNYTLVDRAAGTTCWL